MKRINYFADCPCCGKTHIISVERSFSTQFELDDAALALCSCPSAHARKDVICARERKENGFLDLMRDALDSTGVKNG